MFLRRVFGRTLFAAAEAKASATTTAASNTAQRHNPLEEFFEADRNPDDEKLVVYVIFAFLGSLGCLQFYSEDALLFKWQNNYYKASELHLKSWDDLHKLWYVLLKEKNMVMTQRQMLHAQNLRFPNPERIPKVRKSMCRIKHVLTE
ncbi:hypothetical protein CDL12_26135 [Handroanthus impetiginosus]|uniref:Large ribosomal subunit protein uL29m n=1 Tax=Handroanthus impetiginosus TaxID=429701 RepID=A0A2G9G7U1_9LAMI|nr:hypothetical protein CDL12_26135 [Handroanthus impetiginosus]